MRDIGSVCHPETLKEEKSCKGCTPFLGSRDVMNTQSGGAGGMEFGRTRPGLPSSGGVVYPSHPPTDRFCLRRNGVLTAPTRCQKGLGRVEEGRPLPFPKVSPGPSRAPQSPAHPAPGWSRCRSGTAAGPAPPSLPRRRQELGERGRKAVRSEARARAGRSPNLGRLAPPCRDSAGGWDGALSCPGPTSSLTHAHTSGRALHLADLQPEQLPVHRGESAATPARAQRR